jgi:hypothetical protein
VQHTLKKMAVVATTVLRIACVAFAVQMLCWLLHGALRSLT